MTAASIAVSAPGKVLFTGGFLVLDRQHTGLVFGLNARIHIHAQAWSGDKQITSQKPSANLILVQSPQFRDASWLYEVDTTKPPQDEAVSIAQITNNTNYTTSRNKFVEVTLQYALTYLQHLHTSISRTIKLTILADNDYYSQSTAASSTPIHGFTDFGVTLPNAHKTGLGSSAALVTSLVSALLTFYSQSKSSLPKQQIHNLAQAAHCAAQGKVGSGFDIAAAVFGSCIYRRFTPAILEEVGDAHTSGFGERLHRCVEDLDSQKKWDVEVLSQAVKIPEGLMLVMCDVDCGSETPGMVRQVLQWRKENPEEAGLLWEAIQQGSANLVGELRSEADLDGVSEDRRELADIIRTIRSLVKEMSMKSGVPIEPDVITELLNFCTDLPGVVGGVAPGAGGYDAVALLIRNDSEVLQNLKQMLEGWTSKEENSGAAIGKVRLLGAKQANEGVRTEDCQHYGAWVK